MLQAMSEKKWDLAVELRGKSFARNLETYKMLTRLKPPQSDILPVSCFVIYKLLYEQRII